MKQTLATENPFDIFKSWFDEARKSKEVSDHTEMCLATASKAGRPSARIVLLKKYDNKGFVFFTNYRGRKSVEMTENPFASLCFYWPALEKQIRIEGRVERIAKKESDEYFLTRARESRIGAWTSKQSSELASREIFLEEMKEATEKFGEGEIVRPGFWGGWRVIPDKIEFWQAEEFRFHHRDVFERVSGNKWTKKLIYP